MKSSTQTKFTLDSLIRPLAILPATCLGILFIHHLELFLVEPLGTFKFIISIFLAFAPFSFLSELQIRAKRPAAHQILAIYVQSSFAAMVLYKFIVGPSLIGPFRYRAIVLYACTELLFLAILGLVLILRRHQVITQRSDKYRLFSVIGYSTWAMAIAFVIFVVYRKFNVIPPITITAFAEKFPDSSSNYGLEVFSEDLDIHYPVQIIDAPSEFAEFCVLTRTGEFSLIRKVGDSFEHKVVIDLIGTIGDAPYNELGAAGATFGPKVFEKDGNEYVHLFLYYAFNDNGTIRNRLVSYEMSLKDYTIDESSEKTLIDLIDPDASHNGGAILFGPDSYLYLGIGDAGPENDGSNVSQKIDESLYSGIHRIDVYGDDLTKVKPIGKQPANGKTQGYWIPLDNPFVGKDGVLEEFWALGIRNPLRFSFLPDGKRLIVGDVGQTAYEEVNIISAGDNGQWS